MRRILFSLALLFSGAVAAQTINPATQITWPRVTGSGAPTATCPSTTNTPTTATLGTPYTDLTNSNLYNCMSTGWVQVNAGGGSGITQLTGDVTAGPGSGSQAATLAHIPATPLETALAASPYSMNTTSCNDFGGFGESLVIGSTSTNGTINCQKSWSIVGAVLTASDSGGGNRQFTVDGETGNAVFGFSSLATISGSTGLGTFHGVNASSQKITAVANGTVSTDAAAFGQIPTTLPPNGSAGGDLSGTYPNPGVAKIAGGTIPLSTNVVGTNGSGQLIASTVGSTTVFGPVKVDGTTITASAGVLSAVTGGGGTVTHSAGALTANQIVIGNGSADIKVDPSASTDGAGNMSAASYTANGTTPGSTSLVAGTGSIPALPSNSAGFAAPVTGGTSYLFKLPATISQGIAHFGGPATVDGVTESAITSSAINLASGDVTGVLPAANVATLNQNTTGNAATATNLAGGVVGNIPYQASGSSTSYLLGNTSVVRKFVSETGNGVFGAAPTFDVLRAWDMSPNTYAVATGSVNVLAAAYTPSNSSLVAGLQVEILPNLANTSTTPTFNLDGFGAKTITKLGTSALAASDLTTTAVAVLIYDGTEWQLQNPQTASGGGGASFPGTNNIVFNTSTTASRNATSADAIALWTGTCSSSTFLRGDGSCATATGSTGISGATSGQALIAGSATTATSSIPLAGVGAGLTTGPISGTTSGVLPAFNSTSGQIGSSNFSDSGTLGGYNGTGFASGNLTGNLNICPDTTASGTAQACSTTSTFTPVSGSCIVFSTATANTGAGLTLNVNGIGAKSVAKWLGTTTLAAGDVAASNPQLACYNGTVWNLMTIGNAPSGGGGVTSVTGTANQIASTGGTTPVISLPAAITFPGTTANATNAAASASATVESGTPFSGTGTTSYPVHYFDCAGSTQPTGLNTAGTYLAFNSCSGFSGYFFDIHANGASSVANLASNGVLQTASWSNINANGIISNQGKATMALYATGTNCAGVGTSASPSVATCAAAAAGAFSCAAAASGATCTVNTTAVTANSEVHVEEVVYTGTRLGVTCNTSPTSVPVFPVASISAGVSFTVNVPVIVTNPACYIFTILN